jgi:glycosyltransferase involved in cell wall biosynthesis
MNLDASPKFMAKVLICRSNPIAPDPRVEKEARSLSTAGYAVQILGWDRTGRLPEQEDLGWGEINRQPIRAGFARGVLNFLPLVRWQLHLLVWLVAHRREYDILHACDFDTVLPALLCKKFFHKKVIYDIFDFYADHLRATPAFIKRLIRLVDLWAIGQVDALILVDEQRVRQIAGAHLKRLAILYNTPEDVSPELASQTTGETSIHLAYVGLLQFERGLLDILEVLRRHPEWQMDLAGFGGDEQQVLQASKDLPNVFWHGRVPYDKALLLSSQANVLVALYDPHIENHRYASPNKIFEAMLLAKPVIVARDTNMDRIVEQAGCGIVIDYGDVAALEAALMRLGQDPLLRQRLGQSGRQAYERSYSWRVMEGRLLELYSDLQSQPG